jgi:pimeloyl-ACP methyl ester carboxylesterase
VAGVEAIEVGGNSIEYRRIAAPNASAAVIVFLHEGLGSCGLWRDFPDALCHACGAGGVVYSRFGYGGSTPFDAPRRPRYMHDEALSVLPALLRHWQLERPVLYGHSDGASIALLYSAAFSPAALIVEAPHVFVEERSLDGIRAAREAFISGDLRPRLARYHRDAAATFFGWNDIWLAPEFRDWDITADITSIRCPVLALQGDADPYGTLAQTDRLHSALGARLECMELAGCGHHPHRERREAVIDAAANFLRRVLA